MWIQNKIKIKKDKNAHNRGRTYKFYQIYLMDFVKLKVKLCFSYTLLI